MAKRKKEKEVGIESVVRATGVSGDDEIYWTDSRGNILLDRKQPCKKGETPHEFVLGELIWSMMKFVNLQKFREELRTIIARNLLELFEIKKK